MIDKPTDELEVLIVQMDASLSAPIVNADDALELAIAAGLAARLGAPADTLREAVAWRDGPGRDLLDEVWAVDETGQVGVDWLDGGLEVMLEALDACTGGRCTDEEVDDALSDLDEVIAAAVWCGRAGRVRTAARRAAEIIREVPDPFAPLADQANQIARLPAVAAELGLYDYWFAVADARAAVGEA